MSEEFKKKKVPCLTWLFYEEKQGKTNQHLNPQAQKVCDLHPECFNITFVGTLKAKIQYQVSKFNVKVVSNHYTMFANHITNHKSVQST